MTEDGRQKPEDRRQRTEDTNPSSVIRHPSSVIRPRFRRRRGIYATRPSQRAYSADSSFAVALLRRMDLPSPAVAGYAKAGAAAKAGRVHREIEKQPQISQTPF